MPLVNDRCICLRKYEYSETSQILTLFSREHGVFRAIAKGAHRRTKAGAGKFDGGIDLLDVGLAVFTYDPSRDLSTLIEWSLREGNLGLRKNLRAIYLGVYAVELVGLLLEEFDPHPDLFGRLERVLLELATASREEAFLTFQLDLLRETGYLGDFSRCVACGNLSEMRRPIRFSAARGGLICEQCCGVSEESIPFDARLVRLVQGILQLPRNNGWTQRLPRLTRHQTDPINRALLKQIEFTLGHRTRLGPLIS